MVVDVEALMADTEARGQVEEIQKILENDSVISKLMDAAEGIKDAYEIVKKFVTVKYETFKALCMDVLDYYNADKVALSDEAMDAVVGGGFFGDLWNKCKKSVVSIGVGILWGAAAACVTVAAIGLVVSTAGVGTLAAAAAVGTVVGTGAALANFLLLD